MKKVIFLIILIMGLVFFFWPGYPPYNFVMGLLGKKSISPQNMTKTDKKQLDSHQFPENFSIEIKSDVDLVDEEAFREGFRIMDFYLKEWFGQSFTKKVSATVDAGTGDNKMLEEDGGFKILINTNGEEWTMVKNIEKQIGMNIRKRVGSHEYVHLFQMTRGCVNPLRMGEKAKWFTEGSAEWLSYKAHEESGNFPPFFNKDFIYYPIKQSGSSLKPLKEYEGEGRFENVYPYFNLAVDFLMKDQDIKKLEEFCKSLGIEQSMSTAFENTFGYPLEKFYSDFEAYRKNFLK